MSKNLEILKGIDFNNLNEEGLKKLLVEKFSKNINKPIIPGESYIPVSGKVIDEEDILWGIESMMDAWLTAGRFSVKLERELARYFGSRFSLLVNSGSGLKIYNHKNIYNQQAPMPFVTERTGSFATAVNSPTNEVRGLDVMDQDWSIVQVKHNITETSNNIDLGLFLDSGKTITMDNDTKIQNDWYLKLDGKIDLNGQSQLVQTINSDLEVNSAGTIEREQQGDSNLFNYNYWSSPVGTSNTTSNNNPYTIANVMKDGTTGIPQDIVWTNGYDASPTSPITLSSYWIFKFQNLSNSYANWQYVGPTATLNTAEGFTLKGSGALTENQNYKKYG